VGGGDCSDLSGGEREGEREAGSASAGGAGARGRTTGGDGDGRTTRSVMSARRRS